MRRDARKTGWKMPSGSPRAGESWMLLIGEGTFGVFFGFIRAANMLLFFCRRPQAVSFHFAPSIFASTPNTPTLVVEIKLNTQIMPKK
jgi:hypothetical protein